MDTHDVIDDPCPKCGKQISPDDLLTMDDDGTFHHVDCDKPRMKVINSIEKEM